MVDVNKISYQVKLKILPLLLLLVLIIVYQYTISNTIQLSKEVRALENQVHRLGDAPLRIQILKQRLKEIESKIGNHSGKISREEIFEVMTHYCMQKNLVLREFPLPHEMKGEDYVVDTYPVELEGKYSELLGFIYYLENERYLGKLAGVHFLLKKDRRTRSEYLALKIYLQTIN